MQRNCNLNQNQENNVSSREERKNTGRMIAIVTALFLLSIAIYQAWIRKIAVLAGVIVPALIMVLYAAWVVILTKRDKKKKTLMLENEMLNEVLTTSPSCSSFASNTTNNVITSTKLNATLLPSTVTATRANNLKHKRKCKRKKRLERMERRRKSFLRVKEELLVAHKNIEMPEFTTSARPWTRSHTIT